jgi:hypothetical protein
MGACASGYADCDGKPDDGCEVDVGKDAQNCGGCGKPCGPDNYCWKGVCHLQNCAPGTANCNSDPADGCEVAVATDLKNCGACGNVCADPPNATAACGGGACRIGACLPGFFDCDKSAADGCESNPQNDPNNCGACGNACAPSQVCSAGACIGQGVDLLDGLVDYWAFEGSLDPSIGVDSFQNGPGSELYAGGKIGAAVGITGGPRFTSIIPEVDLNKDITVAFWANYLARLAQDNVAFELGGFHISSHDVFGGKMGMFVQYDAPANNGGGFVGGNLTLVDDSGFLPPSNVNTWFFVVVQRAGNAITMRVNLKGTAKVDVTGKTFAVGNVEAYAASQCFGYNWGGGIDELGIWSRALNDAEIQTLYNGGQGMTLP